MSQKIIHDLQDLTYLSWDKIRNSSGTAGSFLKAYDDLGPKKNYYKLSNYNNAEGIIGHECVNEIIVDRLLNILGIPHLQYQLIHARIYIDNKEITTYLCMSEDFKAKGESKIALDSFYHIEKLEQESLLDFCLRQGWEQYIYEMLVVDFLILNRDRHGANIEVLRNTKNKQLRLAPLFDHGLSLVFSCLTESALNKFNVIADGRIQCCVGSGSASKNLKLIPKDKMPKLKALKETDKMVLLQGLDNILPNIWQEKIWNMIWQRWQAYENFCNTR